MYLIDGNNLAGALGMLGQNDCNQKLIRVLSGFLGGGQKKATIIFDGYGPGCAPHSRGGIRIEYASDSANWRESADDKIVFILRRVNRGMAITVITDDRELRDRVLRSAEEQDRKVEIISASEFAKRIHERNLPAESSIDDKGSLSENEIRELNEELLTSWQKPSE
jgi:hypothetical protein